MRLIEGDCLDVLGTLPAGSVDAVVTSPPYNLGAAPNAPRPGKARRTGPRWEWAGYIGDSDALPEADYQEWQLRVLAELYRVCRDNSSVFYVHKDRVWGGRSISPRQWLEKGPFAVRQQIVWDRKTQYEHSGWYFSASNEWVFWLAKGRPRKIGSLCVRTTVWAIPPQSRSGHPATFPVDLARLCVQASSVEGETVLDPFMGSGTTAVACLREGRRFIGVEKVPEYVEIARRRVEEERARLPLLTGLEGAACD